MIRISIQWLNNSISPMDGTLTGITDPSQNFPNSNGKKSAALSVGLV